MHLTANYCTKQLHHHQCLWVLDSSLKLYRKNETFLTVLNEENTDTLAHYHQILNLVIIEHIGILNCYDYFLSLHEKLYFPSPGISWKVQKYHENINFLDKKRPYFLSLKNSKQELFSTQKIWYSILKKISFYTNFLNQKKTVFSISKKFKIRTFPYSENMVFHAKENIILHQLFESKEDRISHLRKV